MRFVWTWTCSRGGLPPIYGQITGKWCLTGEMGSLFSDQPISGSKDAKKSAILPWKMVISPGTVSWGFLAVKWKDNRKITERCLDLSRHSDEFQQHVVICCNSVTYFMIYLHRYLSKHVAWKAPKQGNWAQIRTDTVRQDTIWQYADGSMGMRYTAEYTAGCVGHDFGIVMGLDTWHLVAICFNDTVMIWAWLENYIPSMDGWMARWLDG